MQEYIWTGLGEGTRWLACFLVCAHGRVLVYACMYVCMHACMYVRVDNMALDLAAAKCGGHVGEKPENPALTGNPLTMPPSSLFSSLPSLIINDNNNNNNNSVPPRVVLGSNSGRYGVS